MKENNQAKAIYLKDYKPSDYFIKDIYLTFDLHDTCTRVTSKINFYRNPDSNDSKAKLILQGEEQKLIGVKLDGVELAQERYTVENQELTIGSLPAEFNLEITTENNPSENKVLEGLYKSGAMFCSQNEPEGFRRITYYLDRPDIMAKFKTKIIADKEQFPILLSNGNPIDKGDLDGGRHWVEWEDPFLKPAYLYAIVAGDLDLLEDTFKTSSGRTIPLQIFCDKGNKDKCHHAMESLKKSMKWDEDVYGLEYDLDIFMIVAVDAFNMGAMENKGLNIFNSSLLLADPKTATDRDYYAIEAVVGHEYFHNWTGNRVTCRDWFQLTLKEGLTVFRDQEFSSDMNSRGVNRIDMVNILKNAQFPEDGGPTAHSIKPASYIEMNNFYTATVYNKGAEVIRMLHTFFGKEGFRKGMDKYFELYDGMAVTTEDFLHAMSTVNNNFDMTQFKNWYKQAGTPEVTASYDYNESDRTMSVCFKQFCRETPEVKTKAAYHMPMKMGLISAKGEDQQLVLKSDATNQNDLNKSVLHITKMEETFVFENIEKGTIPSFNRDFSAPIILNTENSVSENIFLMTKDSDEFNRYEAGQSLAIKVIEDLMNASKSGESLVINEDYLEAYGALLDDTSLDNEFKGLCLSLPGEAILHQRQKTINFDLTHKMRGYLESQIATKFEDKFLELYRNLNTGKEYQFNAESMGERTLKNTCLHYLSLLDNAQTQDLCYSQFVSGNNITDSLAALKMLVNSKSDFSKKAIDQFYNDWKDNVLVIQKWFRVQAISDREDTLDIVKELINNPSYDKTSPNLVRSLLRTFTANRSKFHCAKGYRFIADQIVELDGINPRSASMLASSFREYGKMPETNKNSAKVELERIMNIENLSKDTFEIVSKILA